MHKYMPVVLQGCFVSQCIPKLGSKPQPMIHEIKHLLDSLIAIMIRVVPSQFPLRLA